MKNYVLSLIFIFGTLSTLSVHADLAEHMQKKIFGDDELIKKFTQVSSGETTQVSYETTALGVNIHLGYYPNYVVGTALNGTEQGKQLIISYEGVLIDCSNDISINKDNFSHKYSWGKTESYPYRQIIKRK